MLQRLAARVPSWVAVVLLAAWFALECYVDLKPFGTVLDTLLTFGVTCGAGLLVYGAVKLGIKDNDRAALYATIILATFCCFGYLVNLAGRALGPHLGNRRYIFFALLVFWGLALATATWKGLRARLLASFAVTAFGVLVVFALFRALVPGAPAPAWGETPLDLRQGGNTPDIFYIILDSHTSPESLLEHWNYDSSPFVASLTNAGFFVVPDSRANSDSTWMCMASAFAMERPPVLPQSWSEFARLAYCSRVAQHGRAKRALLGAGYEITEMSIFSSDDGRGAYYHTTGSLLSTVSGLALMRTPLGHAAEHFWLRHQGRTSVEILKKVEKIAATPSTRPRFVYAHVLLPHAPFVFDREGRSVFKGVGTRYMDATPADYLEQLIYTDRLATNLVMTMEAKGGRPKIIILQGDHGYRDLPSPSRRREGLTSLNAVCLPAGGTGELPYPGMTPVNTFRLIFNRYFSTGESFVRDFSAPSSELIRTPDFQAMQ